MMSDESAIEQKNSSWLGDGGPQEVRDELFISLDAIYQAGPNTQRTMSVVRELQSTMGDIRSKILYYGVMENSPIGSIFIAIGEQGLIAIDIGVAEEDFISRLRGRTGAMVIHSQEKVASVVEQLREYFDGERSTFKLPLDLVNLTEFQRQVLLVTLKIPRGQITTYGEMARRLGKVQWARAVGQALARNPIPIVIPCHRVLAADGSLHGYSGGKGIETKAQLLQLEGVLQV
jgi:O-6-methylguanine DNA methyltransferase